MTLLTTVEASGVFFIQGFIWSGWGSLSTLIPSVWSLKKIRARNHLLLRGNKSLVSRSRHRFRALWNGAEDRSSRRRNDIDAGPGVGVLLGLTLLLCLLDSIPLLFSIDVRVPVAAVGISSNRACATCRIVTMIYRC
jgi:hypothetical protein